MCWEHEDKYHADDGLTTCFDYLWNLNKFIGDESIVSILEEAGAQFNNLDKCKEEFFNLLTSWHERKLIEPRGSIDEKEIIE